ncbi:DNA-directed DNA polymerase [Haloferax larsenii]|uniref:DNA-directed DNA polymerase n=1 Tax=Haloferax larsenii TaxID=302484 RepID=A0A1H7NAY1_HALLR|nr:DNA-directed DNA polymerase [Haloferax larsenii]SEL20115.1 replicative DNA polymerase I [Haloferax larsenii]
MLEILVTNTDCIENNDDTFTLRLYGRDADENRHTVTITDFQPYFYVEADEARERKNELLGEHGIRGFDFGVDVRGFFGEEVAKVFVTTPGDVKNAKGAFNGKTFEADVGPTHRVRIDREIKSWIRVPAAEVSIEDVEPIEAPVESDPRPRAIVFDIETDDRGSFPEPGEKRITSLVAYDSYEGDYVGFFDTAGRPVSTCFPNGKPEECDRLHYFPDEKTMLISFGEWVEERDPDLITAWNAPFDAPYIIERMKKVSAHPSRLSPEGNAHVTYRGDPKILGRTIYDLLHAYKKNSWGELRSYSLDYVAQEELGARKIPHEEGYFEMWRDNPEKLMNYNARDVRLTAGIDAEAGVVSFRDSLRKMIGVDFEDTTENFQFIEMMVRRKLKERGEVGPTKSAVSGDDYEGGFVVEPYTGVAKNVIGIDLASLYPMTMKMLNTSPEVKLDETEPEVGKVAVAPNGQAFSLERDGLFRQIVDDALDLKMEYKRKKKAAPAGSELEAEMAEKYQVSKTITNSIYGVCGWAKFFLYDRKTAEAITLAGQAVLKETARYVNEKTVAEVIYGDTDSNYIRFPEDWSQKRCLEEAQSICDALNNEVYPALAESMGVPGEDNLWEIEIEMFAKRFFQWGRKKKYAYAASWKEGMDFSESMDEPEISIKGSAAKRSDASRLTRDTEKRVIKAILSDKPDTEIANIVFEAGTSLDPDDPDWENIGIPGGISKEFSEYDRPTAHVEAAMNSNAILGTEFGKASKPMRCYIVPTYADELGKQIDRIAYESADDLAGVGIDLTPDVGRMTQTLIVNPLGPVLGAVGIDVDAALEGQMQTGLGAFF